MSLILGTAQFGLDYGVTNKTGQVKLDQALEISELAYKNGIQRLDTALDYGNALEVVREVKNVFDFAIISKLKIDATDNYSTLKNKIETSLRKLNIECIDQLLIHNGEDLAEIGKIELNWLIDEGYVKKLGASYYTPKGLSSGLCLFHHSSVQYPLNLFDQRFLDQSIQQKLINYKIEQFGRSAFLQGVLLAELKDLPVYFSPWENQLRKIETASASMSVSKMKLCLSLYNNRISPVVGCTSPNELIEIIEVYDEINGSEKIHSRKRINSADFICHDPNLIIPSNWKMAG